MINKKLLMMTIVVGITGFLTTSVSASPEKERLWGNNRYETGSAIVENGWRESSYYAIIVNGENFPDALSAATLAEKYNAPILLTQDKLLDSNTVEQLKRLNVKSVFIIGGKGVISSKVEKDINKLGIQTTRYSGDDRNETSVKVAEQIGTQNGIIVAIDDDYTDALSAAPIAASLKMPIILVSKNAVNYSVKRFVFMNHIPKTYVLGDSNIISDGVASMFPNVERITGSDKYERNINIIKTFEDKLNFNNVCLAYSEKFADALSGSVLAANDKNPIVLIGDRINGSTNNFIKSKLSSINKVTVLGGDAGIKDNLVNELVSGENNSSNNKPSILNENEGNTSGNLRNGGFVIEKDGWVYYIKDGKKICKSKVDGSEEIKIADVKNARAMNIVGDYIYYVGAASISSNNSSNKESDDEISIYKTSINGGFGTVLLNDREDDFGKGYPCLKVIDHWVCYSPNYKFISQENMNFYDGFYRMDVNTREIKQSSGEYFKSMINESGFIYFTTREDNRIRKMPTSGNKKDDGTLDNKEVDLGIKGTVRDVTNGYVYYEDIDGSTYKIKEDGTERSKIVSLPEKFIINNDWIYYVVPGKDNLHQLRKMKLDGSQDKGLNAYKVESFSITGNWIYYRNSGNGNIYRIRLDGSSGEQFPDKIGVKIAKDIKVKVKKGEKYDLPIAVPCTMNDDSTQYFSVNWNKTNIDTNTIGIYEFSGSLEGAVDKVKLTVEVTNN